MQKITFDSWKSLHFYRPEYDPASFDQLFELYENFFMKKIRALLGQVIMFRLPENIDIPFGDEDEAYGKLFDDLTAVTVAFKKNIYVRNRKICFKDSTTENFFRQLEKEGCLKVAKGGLNKVILMPVDRKMGLMSKDREAHKVLVNSSFFVMMHMDADTVYDHIGTPVGLCVEDGKIIQPPLFHREVLTVKENQVFIGYADLKDIGVVIDNRIYRHNDNCQIYTRPEYVKTPSGGYDLVIADNRAIALKKSGNTEVPSSGFVLKTEQNIGIQDLAVSYCGKEDVTFAMQVGNSCVINGKKTERFLSEFSRFPSFGKVTYPPASYPLNYKKDRAPRVVLGADIDNRPVICWFEGAGKFGYEKGRESCGASLQEVADLSLKLGIHNGIHLDGGGSAQILFEGKRRLKVSDRKPEDYSEVERAVPAGLSID